METQVRTPQMVFMQPQRLVVPLFQRPYVWNEENQWEPLWSDVVRVADRVLAQPAARHYPHFLGAVVLQQAQRQTGQMQERTIIDGQQRLTTLQLMLDALHAALAAHNAMQPAARLEPLVRNADPFCARPEDRFKVWPTNRDRGPFNAVMAAAPPLDYDAVGHRGERMVEAHRYFGAQATEWLEAAGESELPRRAAAIETTVRELLQMVVIDLAADENAQEIFETLNARGAQLTAADLIKNFIFQRLLESGTDVEEAYERYWKEFETGFWETEISVGRLRYARSAIFLNHWLIARTGEEVVAREVFDRFKRFADHEAAFPMKVLLDRIHRAAEGYRGFITAASTHTGPIDQLGLFGYRTGALESEVIKPLVLALLDPSETEIPASQFSKCLDVVESWMVRRMLVRATTKSYSQIVAELVGVIKGATRATAGDAVERHLAGQDSGSRYWPDDNETREALQELMVYRRLGRGRLRMILEALEDDARGWKGGKRGLGEERVVRAKLSIEHVMPRKWIQHWPLETKGVEEAVRDRRIHTLGNLTLLTKRLNSSVSNGAWLGAEGKRQGLERHDVLLLNRELLKGSAEAWTDADIERRTLTLIDRILKIWPVPAGHRSGFTNESKPRLRRKVQLADLLAGGVLTPGMPLFPRRRRFHDRVATLLHDGRVEVDDVAYESPSEAAAAIVGQAMNGWWFFLVEQGSDRSLKSVRADYVSSRAVDAEEEDQDDDGDDEE